MVVIQMTWWYVWLDLELGRMNHSIRRSATMKLSLLRRSRRPGVLSPVVKEMAVGWRWIRAIKRTHHISGLHIQHNHRRRVSKRSELNDRSSYRQPLIRYRTPTVPSWFRVIVIQIE
jgi:hypothetical protein